MPSTEPATEPATVPSAERPTVPSTERPTDVHQVLGDIELASRTVAPSWPLSTTIAVNPLSGFEDRPFARGLVDASRLLGTRGLLTVEEFRSLHRAGRVTREDLDHAVGRARPDLDASERATVVADLLSGPEVAEPRRVLQTVAEAHDAATGSTWSDDLRRSMAEQCLHGNLPPGHLDDPVSPEAVAGLVDDLLAALGVLGVPDHARRSYLERHLTLLPGWVAHLRWREHEGQDHVLLRFLAAAVTTEADLVDGRARYRDDDGSEPHHAPSLDDVARAMVWQDAYERGVHDRILGSVRADLPPPPGDRSDVQMVCCIDVRSEPLRRHLEHHGDVETFGYAGFFGLAAQVLPAGGGQPSARCPAIIRPTATIGTSAARPGVAGFGAAVDEAWKATKVHPVAPLAMVDAAGWVTGPLAALRTLAPSRFLDRPPERPGTAAPAPDVSAVPVATQADVVAAILGLGIGARPARLVVLCGHTSQAANTPTESGLTCGACGGHGGAANASAVATMANDPAVRAELARRGLDLPAETWFVGAEHNTALDRITFLQPVPDTHRDLLAGLQRDLEVACAAVTIERAARLPGARRRISSVRRRAFDWAEPVTELGLAGNAAFVVGPRWMTARANLAGRAFLHSYEADDDPDGTTLAGILHGPLVVAQWINAQYHFSTTDPELLGAGSKALHNVVADVGVLSGPSGDLRRGLALQSVRAGDRLLHEPVRLLTVVHAPLERVDAALAGSTTLRHLVEHEWIHLVARTPGAPGWMQRGTRGWTARATSADPARTHEKDERDVA